MEERNPNIHAYFVGLRDRYTQPTILLTEPYWVMRLKKQKLYRYRLLKKSNMIDADDLKK
ncbi:hypothetical protein [Nostoc sp. FACHB-190]|uniref:hypothetical protein n=1 Tax=Nostoc sp. FACHB-190 TaxID=2692838 RepID=UPI0016829DFF|nr:hypothetical protein [Nostoc sp. FACHB-190]MBD2299944.1 hypothetical protein [Nostoc sp. FACHB-190]